MLYLNSASQDYQGIEKIELETVAASVICEVDTSVVEQQVATLFSWIATTKKFTEFIQRLAWPSSFHK